MKNLEVNLNKTEPSILENMGNLLILAKKLQGVYENRPDLKNFIGCMKGRGEVLEAKYSRETIEEDEKYVEQKRLDIEETNRSSGKENFEYKEGGFQLSEIMQALVVDLMNKDWFRNCKTIMTSDFDDLKVGIDAVMKRGENGYLGMSFDFTVSGNEGIVYEKLRKEWERNIVSGNVPSIKYFEDPDTKEKGDLLVPKFIIGASKKDVEEFASAYLEGDIEKLNNHPFKYTMLLQIEEQLQTFLDFYENEENVNNKKLDFARKKYNQIQTMLRNMKKDIHLEEEMHEKIGIFEYSKGNMALNVMRRFRIEK